MNSRERVLRAFGKASGTPDRPPMQFDLCRSLIEHFGSKLGISPEYALSNPVYSGYVSGIDSPLKDWVIIEIAGVCIGGLISGIVSGRFKFEVIKGPRISNIRRLVLAFSGGMLMAFAAKFTRGCTSGLALSGGSVLSPGAWLFMICVFIGGYSIAFLMRKAWN